MQINTIAYIHIPVLKSGNNILQTDIIIDWMQGQQWCIVGPTGSGKTSLLKSIVGMHWESGARIEFPQIEEMKKHSGYKDIIHTSDKVAFVPQEIKIPSGYLPDLFYQRRYHATEQDDIPTVKEILSMSILNDGMPVDEVIVLMNLQKHIRQPFVQLSNGQTRRLMIAIALLKNPLILVLDNPYTGLDQQARLSLNKQLKLLINRGIHIMVAAHQNEIADMTFVTNTLFLEPTMPIDTNFEMPHYYNIKRNNNNLRDIEMAVEMHDISIKYGDARVLNLDKWQVRSGDRWLIRGTNGSGKSTLLSLIVADHPQVYSNDISILGRKRGTGESIWDVKRRMGYFSSELLRYFSPYLLAKQVVASGWSDIVGQASNSFSEDNEVLVDNLCEWLGISSLLDVRFGNLSFGQQKMILIARAMVRNPELLILDEPLQGMDASWQEVFKTKINQFSNGRTLLYVTHDDTEIPKGDWNVLNLDNHLAV